MCVVCVLFVWLWVANLLNKINHEKNKGGWVLLSVEARRAGLAFYKTRGRSKAASGGRR